MGIKSNRTIASYFNRFGATGLDAVSPAPVPVYTEATGGFISDYTDSGTHYRAHIFTSSGTFVVSQVGGDGGGPSDVEYLVVAGGGGGGAEGSNRGGGGGAGGYRTNAPAPIAPGNHTTSVTYPVSTSPGSYTVTIGGGGSGSPSGQGSDGSDSVFGTITSYRGGGGGQGSQNSGPANEGRPGGSGGGGGSPMGPPSAVEPGGSSTAVTTPSPWPGPATQGFAGGYGEHVMGAWAAGGGGGGAGEVGHNGVNPDPGTSSDGGDGLSNLIAGPTYSSVGVVNPASPGRWFAGGGAGMYFYCTGQGGAGGGGSSNHPGAGDPGVDGTGGGGASGSPGGNGGDGVVIVRYEVA